MNNIIKLIDCTDIHPQKFQTQNYHSFAFEELMGAIDEKLPRIEEKDEVVYTRKVSACIYT